MAAGIIEVLAGEAAEVGHCWLMTTRQMAKQTVLKVWLLAGWSEADTGNEKPEKRKRGIDDG